MDRERDMHVCVYIYIERERYGGFYFVVTTASTETLSGTIWV